MKADQPRILVVDDTADSADMLSLLLTMDGYTVRAVNSAKEALDFVPKFSPVCVLIDIQMPGMNGHELASRLRLSYGDEMVLIAVTGAGSPDDRISDRFAQFDHYLRKPVNFNLLKNILPAVGDGVHPNPGGN